MESYFLVPFDYHCYSNSNLSINFSILNSEISFWKRFNIRSDGSDCNYLSVGAYWWGNDSLYWHAKRYIAVNINCSKIFSYWSCQSHSNKKECKNCCVLCYSLSFATTNVWSQCNCHLWEEYLRIGFKKWHSSGLGYDWAHRRSFYLRDNYDQTNEYQRQKISYTIRNFDLLPLSCRSWSCILF